MEKQAISSREMRASYQDRNVDGRSSARGTDFIEGGREGVGL